jgi:hypothetical protein
MVATPDRDAPLLSAEWLNARIESVTDKAIEAMDGVLEQLSHSGYLPFEEPATPAVLKKMTPEQLEAYIMGLPTLEEKLAATDQLIEEGVPKPIAGRLL